MALPKKVRRKINDEVLILEELKFSRLNPEEFQVELTRVRNFLDGNGVVANSEYRSRISVVEAKALLYFQRANDPDSRTSGNNPRNNSFNRSKERIRYRGFNGRTQVEIVPYKYHLSLCQMENNCGKKIRLEWKFNLRGRLEEMSYRTYPDNIADRPKDGVLLECLHVNSPLNWMSTDLKVYQIPQDMIDIFTSVSRLKSNERYEQYMQWGHVGMKASYKSLMEGREFVLDVKKDWIRKLDELKYLEGGRVLYTIKSCQQIFPWINPTEDGKLTVNYRPNINAYRDPEKQPDQKN